MESLGKEEGDGGSEGVQEEEDLHYFQVESSIPSKRKMKNEKKKKKEKKMLKIKRTKKE